LTESFIIKSQLYYLLTLASFAVPSVPSLAGTQIRSFHVVAVSIGVTWSRRTIALVDIYEYMNRNIESGMPLGVHWANLVVHFFTKGKYQLQMAY